MREKLIELLKDCPYRPRPNCMWELIADHLIANGVTVQKERYLLKQNGDIVPLSMQWIPVTEPPKERGCYLVTVKHWLDGKPVTREAKWNGADWLSCYGKAEITPRVTHWMPLPEPSKE